MCDQLYREASIERNAGQLGGFKNVSGNGGASLHGPVGKSDVLRVNGNYWNSCKMSNFGKSRPNKIFVTI